MFLHLGPVPQPEPGTACSLARCPWLRRRNDPPHTSPLGPHRAPRGLHAGQRRGSSAFRHASLTLQPSPGVCETLSNCPSPLGPELLSRRRLEDVNITPVGWQESSVERCQTMSGGQAPRPCCCPPALPAHRPFPPISLGCSSGRPSVGGAPLCAPTPGPAVLGNQAVAQRLLPGLRAPGDAAW